MEDKKEAEDELDEVRIRKLFLEGKFNILPSFFKAVVALKK